MSDNSTPVNTLDDLLRVYNKLLEQRVPGSDRPRKWLFRGQSIASWSLEPSLDRVLRRFAIPLTEARDFEKKVLREGQRNLHRYLSDLPERKDWAEWLALLQHHGAPTRLLDWSYSFFVGVFFAVDQADPSVSDTAQPKQAKVFAIDSEQLVDIRKAVYEPELPEDIRTLHSEDDKHPDVLTYFLRSSTNSDIILPLNPFRLNERLSIQQGVFLYCPHETNSFDEVYRRMCNVYPGLSHEIVINTTPGLVAQILSHLQDVNVTRRALFPGIDGLCRGLEHKIAVEKNWTFLS